MDFDFDFCTIDKIKILLKLSIQQINVFKQKNCNVINIKDYRSSKLSACSDNWLINYQCDDGKISNFYIGYQPNWNSDKRSSANYMLIEYNPNKVNPNKILNGFNLLFKIANKIKFMYIDFAYDMELKLDDLIVHPRHGNEYTAVIGHGGKIETMYFGTFGECGAVRIYNKSLEQKLNSDYLWTRYEIRVKDIEFGNEVDLLFKLRFNDMQLRPKIITNSDLSDKDYLILNALLFDNTLLSKLDYRNRKKFKGLLSQSLENITLNANACVDAFNEFNYNFI